MEPITCRVEMSYDLPCGRPIHAAQTDCDEKPVCLMHSRDPNKPLDEFDTEIEVILTGTSAHDPFEDCCDFSGFVFLRSGFSMTNFTKNANFDRATFTGDADFIMATFFQNANFSRASFTGEVIFSNATFIKNANFYDATFTGDAYFSNATFAEAADFSGATFHQGADFSRTIFPQGANFSYATFAAAADFSLATFIKEVNFRRAKFHDAALFDDTAFGLKPDSLVAGTAVPTIADFRDARFLKPELVRFLRTNGNATAGLRARFVNSHVEGVQFEAAQWHRRDGRMVLQDELDLIEQGSEALSHEETAIAYRRLIINFEKARAYDLVEDCTIGEFEMKRRDPSRFLFARVLGPFYEKSPLLRHWVGAQVSVVGIYRLASVYGTSYHRALAVLGLLLIGFGVLFSTVVDIKPMNANAISICSQSSARGTLCAGLTHAVEVAALQKDLLYVPVSSSGRMTEVLEQVLIAGQVALLLFALSRRFRR